MTSKSSNKTGILDPDGKFDNPLTGNPYSDNYKELAKNVWSKLPAYEKRDEIIETIKNNQIILVISGTGSGKTVLLPKFVMHVFDYKKKVAVTLPKQTTTLGAAKFSAATLDVELGKEVGYKYRGSNKKHISDKTKLLYATDGTINAKLMKDPNLTEFDAVIIDEAHERKIMIDLLLFLLKRTCENRPEFKLIIMSATINSEIFENYYEDLKLATINISGKPNFPIKSHYLSSSLGYDQLIEKGYDILKDLLSTDDPKTEGAHDILFFISSQNEAYDFCKRLNDDMEKEKENTCKISCFGNVYCVEVHSGISDEKELLATDDSHYKTYDNNSYVRKVVFATNVAESSLTIKGIKYVIDSGHQFLSSYDPELRARILNREFITKAQAMQRMGRAGRTEPGECYHMYTKDDFENKMGKYPEPSIRTSDLTEECVGLLSLPFVENVDKLKETFNEFIEPPTNRYIESALFNLKEIKVIENNKLSKFGEYTNKLGLEIYDSCTYLFSKLYRCSREALKIISFISTVKGNIGNIFVNAKTKDNKKLISKINESKSKFRHKYGDHLSILKIFDKYDKIAQKGGNSADKWCKSNYISKKTMDKIRKDYRKIRQRTFIEKITEDAIGYKINDKINNLPTDDRILACFILGYRLNTAAKSNRNPNMFRTRFTEKAICKISKNSFLSQTKRLPKHVFFYELFISQNDKSLNVVSALPEKIYDILMI